MSSTILTGGHTRVRPGADVVAQRMGATLMLLHMGTNRFFELNRTGARLWELLQHEPDPARIADQLGREYAVERSQLAAEVEQLLLALHREQLIELYDQR